MGVLIEHFAGHFPTWLSPEQIRIIPISEKYHEYAESVQATLATNPRLRVGIDRNSEKVGAKIRLAQIEKIPYMLIIGAQEEEDKVVTIRHRNRGDMGAVSADQFLADVTKEIRERRL